MSRVNNTKIVFSLLVALLVSGCGKVLTFKDPTEESPAALTSSSTSISCKAYDLTSRFSDATPTPTPAPTATPSPTPTPTPTPPPEIICLAPNILIGGVCVPFINFNFKKMNPATASLSANNDSLPDDFSIYPVLGSFTVDSIDVPAISASAGFPGVPESIGLLQSKFGVVCEGTLRVDTEADYTLGTTSSDGSAVLLDGIKVVDNDGVTGSPHTARGSVHLSVGTHTVQVQYFHKDSSTIQMQLFWSHDGQAEGTIPPSSFNRDSQ